MESSKDAAEQDEARFLRRACFPWTRPALTWQWLSSCIINAILKLLEVAFSRGIKALIPGAMILLLAQQGANSSAIILNGLSVAFVLELDNVIPQVI